MLGLVLTLALTSSPPELALLCTQDDASELRFQRAGAAELAPVAARFTHVKGEEVKGTLLPGTHTVVAVAQTLASRDRSFASSLVRLTPGESPVAVVDRVAYATRPLVTRDGRVFVQRGTAGPAHVDALTVDEVNPRTGAARTVLRYDGFTTFLAGAADGELLVYRVGPGGGDLVAVHEDALGVRVLVSHLVPMARDFTLDGHTLYFTQLGAAGDWVVMRVDTKTGEPKTLLRGPEVTLLPTPLPAGLAFSPGPGQGLRFLNAATAMLPRGPGFERVRGVLGGWAVGLNEVPGDFPTAFAVELSSGRALSVSAPALSRLDIAGALP